MAMPTPRAAPAAFAAPPKTLTWEERRKHATETIGLDTATAMRTTRVTAPEAEGLAAEEAWWARAQPKIELARARFARGTVIMSSAEKLADFEIGVRAAEILLANEDDGRMALHHLADREHHLFAAAWVAHEAYAALRMTMPFTELGISYEQWQTIGAQWRTLQDHLKRSGAGRSIHQSMPSQYRIA